MIKLIMARVIIKIDKDLVVEIEGHHSEVEVSMGRIIREDHDMSIIIGMTLGETIIERHKIIEVKLLEKDIGIIVIETTTLEELEVALEKDNVQVILAEMIEVAVVDQDQV